MRECNAIRVEKTQALLPGKQSAEELPGLGRDLEIQRRQLAVRSGVRINRLPRLQIGRRLDQPALTSESSEAKLERSGDQDALRVQANLGEDGERERGSGDPQSIARADADDGSPRHVGGRCYQESSVYSGAADDNVFVRH